MTDITARLADALRDLTQRCDGLEGMREDGLHIDTCAAAYALAAYDLQVAAEAAYESERVKVEVSYEVWQDHDCVASAHSPVEEDALLEAQRYAAQYAQDGPVEIVRLTRETLPAARCSHERR